MYEYRIVQIPPNVAVQSGANGSAGAKYLQKLVNFGAEKGWEFFRIDTIGHPPAGGCQVVTFRREHVFPIHAAPDPAFAQHAAPHFEPTTEVYTEPPVEEPHEEKPWWR